MALSEEQKRKLAQAQDELARVQQVAIKQRKRPGLFSGLRKKNVPKLISSAADVVAEGGATPQVRKQAQKTRTPPPSVSTLSTQPSQPSVADQINKLDPDVLSQLSPDATSVVEEARKKAGQPQPPQFAPGLAESAFADAKSVGIETMPEIVGKGRSGRAFQADRIDAQAAARANEQLPRTPAERQAALNDVTQNALFSGQGRVQLPGGIDPFAGVIGAPGSGARFTGSSDFALASQGLTQEGASAKDKLMASRKARLRNAKTLEDKARLQAQFDAQDAGERRAGEAVKVGLAQADAQAGKTQADRQSKETQARLENRSKQRQAELKGLEGDPDAQREARERHQTEDFIDANNDGQTTNEEYQQAYKEMQETLSRFESLTPEQQAQAKNTWTYMRALALQKYLMGKAKKEAEETGGGFFSNLFGGK